MSFRYSLALWIFINILSKALAIAALLISILKTKGLLKVLATKTFKTDNNEVVKINDRVDKIVKNWFKSKKLKNTKYKILICSNIGVTRKYTFLTSGAKKAFSFLRQLFIKALIL